MGFTEVEMLRHGGQVGLLGSVRPQKAIAAAIRW